MGKKYKKNDYGNTPWTEEEIAIILAFKGKKQAKEIAEELEKKGFFSRSASLWCMFPRVARKGAGSPCVLFPSMTIK